MKKQKPLPTSDIQSPASVADLHPAEYNPRNITDEQLALLGKALAEYGDLGGIVHNRRTGNLVGGHQRFKHLDPAWRIEKRKASDPTGTVAMGSIDTPFGKLSYREVDWDEHKERAANLAANNAGGTFDLPAVAEILRSLDGQVDLSLTAFTQDEIMALYENSENLPAPLTPFNEFTDGEALATGTVRFSFGDHTAQVRDAVYKRFARYVDGQKRKGCALLDEILSKLLDGADGVTSDADSAEAEAPKAKHGKRK